MRKLFICAALLCVAASSAQGQESGETKTNLPSFVRLGDVSAEAARLLKSGENVDRAWGAYLVGLHGLKEHAPLLVSLLEDESLRGGGRQETFVRQAALDALIRLDAEVPAESLLPLYQSEPDEVLILLARSPEKNQRALLTLFTEDATNTRWLAAGNLLAETRAPGFAARVLGGLKIEASVYVFDREGEHDTSGTGRNGGGGCGGSYSSGSEFPPVGYYLLVDYARRGATVLTSGPRVVYYARETNSRPCTFDGWLDRDAARIEYVEEILRGDGDELTNFSQSLWHELVCKDAAQCRKAFAGARDEILRAYDALVRRLLKESLLDGAEAAELKPDITLNVSDRRVRKSFPLPDKLKGVKLKVVAEFDIEPETSTDDATRPIDHGPPVIPPR